MYYIFLIIGIILITKGIIGLREVTIEKLVRESANDVLTSEDNIRYENNFKKSVLFIVTGILFCVAAWFFSGDTFQNLVNSFNSYKGRFYFDFLPPNK